MASAPLRHALVAERAQTGAGVEDDARVAGDDLDARGVAAGGQPWPGRRDRAANTEEANGEIVGHGEPPRPGDRAVMVGTSAQYPEVFEAETAIVEWAPGRLRGAEYLTPEVTLGAISLQRARLVVAIRRCVDKEASPRDEAAGVHQLPYEGPRTGLVRLARPISCP